MKKSVILLVLLYATSMVSGQNEIKIDTEPIAFGATLENANDKLVLKSKFIIDRTRWAITYESKSLLSSLKDDIISDAIAFEVIVYTK
ncbi:hypothetical protein L0P88_11635 [Muricauda sp. SCSIO 64092]|uniref:hypothetical protein n=1 Tax=Allomuricauda sp. SCSIO 64092 TaxID=2908842 RepID=UPI001FF249EB|nr:hypothetical protein [Muricauda sp. SCSIO 64092]UOY09162.1 hypothetical protein L0P88_11635 [Muricauda sp. SCSIO 64092]